MKLGCTGSPCWSSQGCAISCPRNFRIRLKMLWMMFMTGRLSPSANPWERKERTIASPHPAPDICAWTLNVWWALTWRWLCWGTRRACGEWRPGRWRCSVCVWTRSRTLKDLVSDVALDHLHEVLHLVSVELQLMELSGATGTFHQRWDTEETDYSYLKQFKDQSASTTIISNRHVLKVGISIFLSFIELFLMCVHYI